MLYLVLGEFIDPGPALPPQQLAALLENQILPGLEQLAGHTRSGRVVGGLKAGAREGVFIVQAENNKDIDAFLYELPFWSLLRWTVVPLQSLDDRIPLDRQAVQMLKSL
jgi:hypothetical protein